MRITAAAAEHVPAIAAIYAEAARTSYATFDLEGHPESWWHNAVEGCDQAVGHMILVAVGDGGRVLGYAKSGEHKVKPAYDTTSETSVYVASAGRGRGTGRALYAELLARLDASPLRLAVAGVADPNDASTRLHVASGFTRVGTFSGVGAKRGRAWDVTWYQRPLAAPGLVAELRALVGRDADAAAAAIATHLGGGGVRVIAGQAAERGDAGAVPILDPADGTELGAILVAAPLGKGDRLLLEWCAEALVPVVRD